MSECPKCLEQFENDDECVQSDHGLCWPCASAKLDEVLLDARAQRIRDIVAQQWAVAWVILEGSLPLLQTWEFDGLVGEELAKQWDAAFAEVVHDAFHKRWPSTPLARHLAALPSAAEIVGGEP